MCGDTGRAAVTMKRPRKRSLIGVILVLACIPVYAQSIQFLPEIDAHLKLNSTIRAYLEAKDDRDGGETDQFAIGPSLQAYLKPLIKLKDVAAFDLNDAKTRFLVLETGYRYLTAPDAAPTNRLETIVTSNFPTGAGFYISDRNRADIDWKSGNFGWRYRNRLTVNRPTRVFAPHLPLDPLRGRRTVLHEPVRQMGHYCSLCGCIVSLKQALRTQHLLRAREQHRQEAKSTDEFNRARSLSLFLRREEMKQREPDSLGIRSDCQA